MNTQLEDAHAVLARIEKLEHENHLLKRIGLAVLLVGSVGFLMGQAKPDRPRDESATWQKQTLRAGTIQASKIELLGPEGGVRAKLVATQFGAAILMSDDTGKPRVSLSSIVKPALLMGELIEDPNFAEGYVQFLTGGKQTVTLIGRPEGAMLELTDQSGKERASLSVSGPDAPAFLAHTSTLTLASDAPSLHLGWRDGYHTEIGTTDLITKATGESHRTSAASVVLFDDKGNVIWRAP